MGPHTTRTFPLSLLPCQWEAWVRTTHEGSQPGDVSRLGASPVAFPICPVFCLISIVFPLLLLALEVHVGSGPVWSHSITSQLAQHCKGSVSGLLKPGDAHLEPSGQPWESLICL